MSPTARIPREQTNTLAIVPARSAVVWAVRQRAEREAAAIVARAKGRARRLLRRARLAAREQLKVAAQKGLEAGQQKVAREIVGLIRQQRRFEQTRQATMIRLAAAMAERLLEREMALQPETVVQICERVLRENQAGKKLTLQLAPTDRVLVDRQREVLEKSLGIDLALAEDPRLGPGECLVSGPSGCIDGRFQVQLEQLMGALGLEDEGHDPDD